MQLTRASSLVQRLATRCFTNRYGSFEIFKREFEKLKKDIGAFRVISFYGIGGIGKTALLKELHAKYSKEKVQWVLLDLESTVVTSPVEVIYEIYRETGLRDFLLEYTLALIWEHRGRSIEDIRNRIVSTDGVLAEVVDVAFGAVETMVGAKTVRRIFESSIDTFHRNFGRNASQVDLVNEATESEREQLLVEFMATAIRKQALDGKRFVFSIDSLHWMDKREGFFSSHRKSDDWLLALIGGAKIGLWILTSREKLKWAKEMPAWGEFLEEHLLGRLSDEDCEIFLQGVPVVQLDIAEKIKADSRGIPIFLDLSVSLYLSVAESKKDLKLEDFDFDPTQLVKRYLSHLEPSHAYAIEVMSLLDEVDREIALALFRAFNLQVSFRDYRDVCDSMLALPLDQNFGDFRIHSDIRETIVRGLSRNEIAQAFRALIDLVWEMVVEGSNEQRNLPYAAWIFARTLTIQNSYSVFADKSTASRLFLVGYRLMEAGFQDVFAGQIHANDTDWTRDSTEVHHAVEALVAYALRRRGKLKEARSKWLEIDEVAPVIFTPTALSVMSYLKAHTDHLLGHYDAARNQYQILLQQHPERAEPHLLLTRRQLADIQMLKGNFLKAREGFEAELSDKGEPIWHAETLRHLGHLYRFNFCMEKARSAYTDAQLIATNERADIISAKLQTNFVELDSLAAPLSAIERVEEAIEANMHYENLIEVGKCQAAAGVAYARLGNFDRAITMIDAATSTQMNTGYRSGVLFAMTARSYLEFLKGDCSSAAARLKRVESLSQELGVYAFYSAYVHWGLSKKIREIIKIADWLVPEKLEERIERLNI